MKLFLSLLFTLTALSAFAQSKDAQMSDLAYLEKKVYSEMLPNSSYNGLHRLRSYPQDLMTVTIDLKSYPQASVLILVEDMKKKNLPVSYNNGVMTLDWKGYYCQNYTTQTEKLIASFYNVVSHVSRNEAWNMLNSDACPVSQELSLKQREELMGRNLKVNHYGPYRRESITFAEFYERLEPNLQKMDQKSEELTEVATKYCNRTFKNKFYKVLSKVLPMKEEYLVPLKTDLDVKQFSFNQRALCSKQASR